MNSYSNEIREAGYTPFFWNGYSLTLLPIVEKTDIYLSKMMLSNSGLIVIPFKNKTYVWENHNHFGKHILPEIDEHKYNREVWIENFKAIAANDQGDIIGLALKNENEMEFINNESSFALWRVDQILTFLPDLLDHKNDNLNFDRMTNLGWYVDINNKGQILCHGFFGSALRKSVCLLNPTQDNSLLR
ncbi:hypothetical protein [Candidatus Protochlamydia phocaeensis]|uniref:hypothetical protein n=1 Tax=Candidatus Protochlamydia phocaeensis TaxID=1414722 RepID=UPI0008384D2E|nr:hypothetical protein [Candidatus Protochlamydia phocaeensis]